ncbi:MAG TPA: phenylalanine--tRNA ligase subunit alpha [Candidatus Humimicrobiaceae bacterium]|nr:phenylalanine--tRNA ligase subunit alpha [Candidatus Humimicrobiaceae bacterium]
MSKINLKKLKIEAQKEIKKAQDLKSLNEVFNKYLGKRQGELVRILRSLEKMPKAKRAKIGREANKLKDFIKQKIEMRAEKVRLIDTSVEKTEWIDVTVPGKKPLLGHLHPLTQVKRKAEEILQSMGFSVVEGPEIETEWYNFNALNFPKEHPARDVVDTFWLRNGKEKLLLRTHTSPVQVRYMEKNNPPLRIIIPGRVFRPEATDASHEINFYHLEGLMVDKDISAANFKAIIQEFYGKFFGKPVKVRFIPTFFPFVEPGFQVDISCLNCQGRGCSACQQSGWLEMMGAGMVHPNVFKNSGLNPKFWQGLAFGMGIERLAMMKYKINDIRLFYSGDLRFLNQF